jgi:NTE family protein
MPPKRRLSSLRAAAVWEPFQAGILRELMHAGVSADLVLGSPVGAMNAAYFAGAAHAAGVNKLEEVWRGLRRHDVFPVTFRSVLGFMGGADNLIDSSNLRKLIERNIPFANLEDAPIPVHVVATNLSGVAICLSSGPAVEALLASAAPSNGTRSQRAWRESRCFHRTQSVPA